MRSRRTLTRSSRRRGAVAVEIAIVLPLLLLIFFSAVELYRLKSIQHAAENAVYEGARNVIVPGAQASEGQAKALAVLQAAGISSSTAAVAPSVITDTTTSVTVSVNVPMATNSWLGRWITGGNLTRSITLRCERAE